MGQKRSSGTDRGRPNKVARLIEQYDLDGIGDELERKWTMEGSERSSLRELAETFNRRVLQAAITDAGIQTLDGEGENLYRLLTDDSVSAADRTRARRRLEREGLDIDELMDDFVSYQAIRTYLQTHRDATYERDDTERIARMQTTVRRLQNRLTTVTESKLNSLADADKIDIDAPGVLVDVQVICKDCGYRVTIDDLTDGVNCECT